MLTDGWQATKAFDYGDDTCVIVGLVSDPNPSTNHRFHFTTINGKNEVLKVDTFKLPDSDYVSYHSPFGVYNHDDKIVVAGLISKTVGLYGGGGFTFSKKLVPKAVMSVAHGSTSSLYTQIYSANNQLLHYGGFQDGSRGNSVQTYLTLERVEDTITRTFNNETLLSNYGDCIMLPKQIIPTNDDSYLLVNTLKPVPFIYRNIYQGLIIKVDSLGTEQWRLPIWEDSTSVHDLVVAPLANGNFLAMYQNFYYQPYMEPPYTNRYPAPNLNMISHFVEFSNSGDIIRKYNLKEKLKNRYKYEAQYNAGSHFMIGRDSSILICGTTSNSKEAVYSDQQGFLLKLDKNGQYLWYRQYELSIATPYNGGKENIFSYGITALKNGGYALAGEYRSDPSASFPNGTQRGLVLFVDEYGCMEPGCQINDNISVDELKAANALFSVYPNPTSGRVQITSANKQIPEKVEVYDMQGRAVDYTLNNRLTSNQITLNSPSGIYYLKIYRTDGFYETYKIIKQ
jgi:hypothetical protein